jgi:hypothetical protein
MQNSEAVPAIFFILSFYVFAVMLLYALARAWQKALSTRADRDSARTSLSDGSSPMRNASKHATADEPVS